MLKLTIKKDLETIQNSSSIQTNVLSDQDVDQIKNLSLKCFIDPNMKSNDNLTMGKLTWIYAEKEQRFWFNLFFNTIVSKSLVVLQVK